jgi:hypothetical protein
VLLAVKVPEDTESQVPLGGDWTEADAVYVTVAGPALVTISGSAGGAVPPCVKLNGASAPADTVVTLKVTGTFCVPFVAPVADTSMFPP